MIRFTIDPRSRPFVYEITTASNSVEVTVDVPPEYEATTHNTGMRPEYDLRGGIRGKYFGRYGRWVLLQYLKALYR